MIDVYIGERDFLHSYARCVVIGALLTSARTIIAEQNNRQRIPTSCSCSDDWFSSFATPLAMLKIPPMSDYPK